MTPGAQTTGNIAVYGSVKQLVIKVMVWTANPTKFWSFVVTGVFFQCNCLNWVKYARLSAAVVIFPWNNIQKTITTLFFFLGKLANVLLRNFYYNALGAFFDALIQRTDGCTEFLWLLVQPHHSIHCSYKRYINRYLSQHMIFQYQDEDSGEPMQMYRLNRAFSA